MYCEICGHMVPLGIREYAEGLERDGMVECRHCADHGANRVEAIRSAVLH